MTALLPLLLMNPVSADLNIQVEGPGYLRFIRDGRAVYAKSANLVIEGDRLSHEAGPKLIPEVLVRQTGKLSVTSDGTIELASGNNKRTIGKLILAVFDGELSKSDDFGFFVASDRPQLIAAGSPESGSILLAKPAKTSQQTRSISSVQPPVKSNETSARVVESASAVSENTLALKSFVELAEGDIKLSDIATASGSKEFLAKTTDLVLDPLPAFGASRRVDRGRVEIRLKQAGLDPKSIKWIGPTSTEVRRRGQSVANSEFESAASSALLSWLPKNAKFSCISQFPPMLAPIGETKLTAGEPKISGQTAAITVSLHVNGQFVNSRTLTYRFDATAKLPPPGTKVTVFSSIGGIRVESTGKIIRVDNSTQTVEVEISDSKTIVTGTWLGDGKVEVRS